MRFIFDFHCLKYQKEIMMNFMTRRRTGGDEGMRVEKFMKRKKFFEP